jgi:hypothetical protein
MLVPSAFNPRDNSPLIGLRRAGPTTRAICRQATIHMASTHNGVDLASSDGRKALGMDGRPIVPHRQIHGSDKLRRSSRDDNGRSSSSALESVSDWSLRPRWRPFTLAVLDNQLREDMLREEMTARSRGPQSPRRGHAIRWHGPAVFDNL